MAKEILLPQWGMGMNSGTIIRWLKNVGDPVEVDDELVEVEASKVTDMVLATESGILGKIVAVEGQEVPVAGVLGYIVESGEAFE